MSENKAQSGSPAVNKQALFGLILEREGVIVGRQIESILAEQARLKASGRSVAFGQVALDLGLINQAQIMHALKLQAKVSYPAGGRKRLGMYLLEAGLLTPSQLASALDEQATRGEKLGVILIEHGWLAEPVLEAVLAQQRRET